MIEINFVDLIWIFIPLGLVYYIYKRWSDDSITLPYGLSRMVIQLIMIGYLLTFIFETKEFSFIITILFIMLLVAGYISLRPIKNKNIYIYGISVIAISIGGIVTLSFVIFGVLELSLWYEPRFLIPLAGMIFANSMNCVSIGAERFESEYDRSGNYIDARNKAFHASLIGNINTLFAVGLVAIPGMMTGQILSGVSPMIAVKYQIMVMCMVIASGGISAAIYLHFGKRDK
jgi:putative ABC transport system permease protein